MVSNGNYAERFGFHPQCGRRSPQNEGTEAHSRKLLAREGQAGSDRHPRTARAEGGVGPSQQGCMGPRAA